MPIGNLQHSTRSHTPNPAAGPPPAPQDTDTARGGHVAAHGPHGPHGRHGAGHTARAPLPNEGPDHPADSFEIVPVNVTAPRPVDTSGRAIIRGLMRGAGSRSPEATMRIVTRELGTGPGMLAIAAEVTPEQVRYAAVAEGASPVVAAQIAERFVETTRYALHTAVVDAAASRAAEVGDDLRARQHPSQIEATTEAVISGQDPDLLERMRGAGIGEHDAIAHLQTEYEAASTPEARAAILARAQPVVARGLYGMEQLVRAAAEEIPRIYAQDTARQLEEFFPGAERRVLRNAGLTVGRIRRIGTGAGGSVLEEGAARGNAPAMRQRRVVEGINLTLGLIQALDVPVASRTAAVVRGFAGASSDQQEATARSMAAATGDGTVRDAVRARRAVRHSTGSR